ncbi:MAG: METTL5 family protein [Candidatus Nanohaloarchaea archaeon]|nr:METTL5 family protein [Candidatus Nanohaloarchaea archaeon]
MDSTELKILLSHLEEADEREAGLEQYRTPPRIAADLLNRVELQENLEGKSVADLGCGEGSLALGAAVLGAESLGIDVDGSMVEAARRNRELLEEELGREIHAEFEKSGVREFDGEADVVVMNPPFGMRREDENLAFLDTAFRTSPVVYALLHSPEENTGETRGFVSGYADDHGFESGVLETYRFPLPRSFEFHGSERKHINVDLYRFERRQ